MSAFDQTSRISPPAYQPNFCLNQDTNVLAFYPFGLKQV